MIQEISILDRSLGIIAATLYWWHNIRDRCPESLDGLHGLTIAKNSKVGCQYCGKELERAAPGTDGRDN